MLAPAAVSVKRMMTLTSELIPQCKSCHKQHERKKQKPARLARVTLYINPLIWAIIYLTHRAFSGTLAP